MSGAPSTRGSVHAARMGGGIWDPYPPGGVCTTGISSACMPGPYVLTVHLSIVTVVGMSRNGTDVTGASAEVDGRRLRREQNREAVLDALVELFAEGLYQPSANDIAERAGISPRSLFRYFDDIDDLNRATIERQLAAARPRSTSVSNPTHPRGPRSNGSAKPRIPWSGRSPPPPRAPAGTLSVTA